METAVCGAGEEENRSTDRPFEAQVFDKVYSIMANEADRVLRSAAEAGRSGLVRVWFLVWSQEETAFLRLLRLRFVRRASAKAVNKN